MDSLVETTSRGEHWLASHSIFVQYLIVRNDNNRLNILTLPTDEGESLPVFGNERAAQAFLRSDLRKEGWHVRESTAGELISLLMGHVADVDLVAPNPLAIGATGETVTPEILSKKNFISSLMEEPILLSHN